MTLEFPDDWLRFSSNETYLLLVNPKILPADAVFIEEMNSLAAKTLHRFALRNETKRMADSEETRKACAEFWDDFCKHIGSAI